MACSGPWKKRDIIPMKPGRSKPGNGGGAGSGVMRASIRQPAPLSTRPARAGPRSWRRPRSSGRVASRLRSLPQDAVRAAGRRGAGDPPSEASNPEAAPAKPALAPRERMACAFCEPKEPAMPSVGGWAKRIGLVPFPCEPAATILGLYAASRFQPEDASMTQTKLNRRLTTLDSTFLYFEKAEQPMHIGGCMLYEGRISRDELARTLRDRLHRLPRYRQKVVFPPFTLTHPTWEDDPDFDVANHIDEVTLPAPADDRVLAEVGGRVYAGMLDRAHPLWKLILLDGRPDGSTAIVWKIHHAMIDGVSG